MRNKVRLYAEIGHTWPKSHYQGRKHYEAMWSFDCCFWYSQNFWPVWRSALNLVLVLSNIQQFTH